MSAPAESLLLVAIALCSAYIVYIGAATLMQVSRGYSMLDEDAPQGLKLRKWFLVLITAVAFLRGIVSIWEVIVLEDKSPISDHMLWLLKFLPSLAFLWSSAFLSDYLWQLSELLEVNAHQGIKKRFISLGFLLVLFLSTIVYHFAVGVLSSQSRYLRSSELLLAVSGLALGCSLFLSAMSVARTLQQSTVASNGKILTRFLLLLVSQLVFILMMAMFRGYEAFLSIDVRTNERWALAECVTILLCECLCSACVVWIITNRCYALEEYIRKYALRPRRFAYQSEHSMSGQLKSEERKMQSKPTVGLENYGAVV